MNRRGNNKKTKLISVMTACFNEEENIEQVYHEVKQVFKSLKQYRYEHVFIDNSSKDKTVEILKRIAVKDRNVKIIVNASNFGHIRSPFHGLLQTSGDAVISIVADLQDPPKMIADFLRKWEEGYKIVIGVKTQSKENPLIFLIRKIYYHLIAMVSETEQVKNFTGFGLYDRDVIAILKQFRDPSPYFRGMIAEIGFERAEVPYTQPKREKGKSKNNFYTLYDMAMLGFVNHSKVPLRMAVFIGFIVAVISFLISMVYLAYKLIYWDRFQLGMAPMVIGFFFLMSVQMIFIGFLGEYVSAIYAQVKNRPLVVEKERVNFDK
ncbi:MAG: glycosyltransferase [Spirochaetae bacterium HGW-Spirochaetae-5]|jgi:glycosyltransferase involved in cell wall biosynthesis|nr:MAG: glycosyltransferase [Spirochaetae bacterium HGW-Spirochaetae-5]